MTRSARLQMMTAITAGFAAGGSVKAATNTPATWTSGTALDAQGSWSTNAVPGPTNDAIMGTGYPTVSLATGLPTLSSNQSFGSIDDLQNSAISYFNIYGGTPNTSTYTLTLGAGGNNSSNGSLNNSNGVTGANPNDLIYVASGGEFDIRLGGNASNVAYAIVALSLAATGNFDTAGTGIIYDNNRITGTGTLVKTGTGTLYLESANSTWTGGLVINAGEVSLASGGALGASPATATTQLTFNASSTLQVTGTSGFGSTRIFNISNGSVATIDSDGETFGIQGPIIGNGSLVKIGTGTITFNSSSGYTYTGSTNISAGALQLNVSSSIPTTPLTLGNGASLLLVSGYQFNQSFPSVAVTGPGASVISAPLFNTSGQALNLGALTRGASGTTLDLVLPSNGSITTTSLNANFSGGQQTILGGWATVSNESNWAVSTSDGTTPGAITGLPQAAFDQTLAVPGADVDVTPSATSFAANVTTINSLRFNTPSSVALTLNAPLTIATGGILETAAVGANNYDSISGGSITSGNGQDLILIQANTSAFFTLNSNITDAANTSIGLTVSGPGTTLLAGTNTFTGPTNVNAGTLELYNSLALQNSTLAKGTVKFAPGITDFTIGGIGTSSEIILSDTSLSGVTLTFGGNNQNTTFSQTFQLSSGSTNATLIKVGTGDTYLSDGNSTFTGNFNIVSGTISFISGASFGAATNVPSIDAGAAVAYNGSGASVFGINRSFLLAGGTDTIQIGSINTAANTSTSALTIGAVGNASSGTLSGPGTLEKTGLGTLYLAYNNSYGGGTIVAGGTLVIQSDTALGVSTLGGSGPLAIIPTQLTATVDLQDPAPVISSLTSYISGNASGGTASIVLGAQVVNTSTGTATALTIGADNTSTTFSGNISDLSANYSGAIGSVIKVGTGVLTLSGSNSYTGSTNVSAGGLVLASATALPASSSLTIAQGTTVMIANHANSATYVPTTSLLSNSGTLDITNNAMVIHNGSIGTIYAEIQSAYNGGTWTGTNASAGVITSSIAAADTTHLTAVGVATGLTSFEGQTVLPSDVLVKYTYYGDANLDGHVDGSDYSRIDNGALNNLTGWSNGDFNYDGVINGSDYTLIDNAYNSQGADLAASIASPTAQIAGPPSAVPEPTILGILTLGGIGMLGRRRRR